MTDEPRKLQLPVGVLLTPRLVKPGDEEATCVNCDQLATHVLFYASSWLKCCTSQGCVDANVRRAAEATRTVIDYWCVTCGCWAVGMHRLSTMEHPMELRERTYRVAVDGTGRAVVIETAAWSE